MAHKRTTVYLTAELHKALRLRAAEQNTSVSVLVNAADLDAFLLHREEQNVSFESFICGLRRRGKI